MKPTRRPRFQIWRALLGLIVVVRAVAGQPLAMSACPEVRPQVGPLGSVRCGEFECGVDRWPVKTLTDRDRHMIDFNVRPTTVRALGSLRVPSARPQDRRASVHERRVYCVEAWLLYASPQEDGDLHLALLDVGDETSEMVAEIPEPRCTVVCRSPYASVFATARATVERRLATDTTGLLRVVVAGVGFFDRKHGQSGAAANYFELHPVLSIRFVDVEGETAGRVWATRQSRQRAAEQPAAVDSRFLQPPPRAVHW